MTFDTLRITVRRLLRRSKANQSGWQRYTHSFIGLKKKSTSSKELMLPSGGSDRRRSGDLSIFSRTLYQLSYRA